MHTRRILFAKSQFSIGESLLEPKSIVAAAKELGLDAVALADVMTVSGMVQLTTAAKNAEIKPIVGVRLRVVEDPTYKPKRGKDAGPKKRNRTFYPALYARNEDGLKRIFRLLTRANDDDRFYYVARLGLDDVLCELDPDALILTTGDVYSAFPAFDAQMIVDKLHAHMSTETLYLELEPGDTPLHDKVGYVTIQAAKENGLQTLLSWTARYKEGGADTLDVLSAISGNKKMGDTFHNVPHLRDFVPCGVRDLIGRAVRANRRVMARYEGFDAEGHWMKAFDAHDKLIEQIDYVWDKMPPSLPVMAEDEYGKVVRLCKEGWAKRFTRDVYGHRPTKEDLAATYVPRLRYELDILKAMGFCGYFLLVDDIVRWAKNSGIAVGPGRGSVGGSLVAYLMGITDVDPIRFNLIFERFINPERIDLPDIDLDFMSERRSEVIEYITNKYGAERVAGISNYTTLASASALRDAGRVFNLDGKDLRATTLVPKLHGKPESLDEAAGHVTELSEFRSRHPALWNHATALEGCMRSLGRHAAGVVVGGVDLVERAVVERRSGEPTINWDKRVCEDMGLVKLDVLGLSTLDVIELARAQIYKRHGKRIDLADIKLDDERILKAFGEGDTVGVFQFESGGMRKLLKSLAAYDPLTFEDIAAATALYRPGPMDSGLMDDYVAISQGVGEPHYDHENMRAALESTKSVVVYQEQVMQVARDLAGFTFPESDKLRKAMGKKLPEEMAKYKEKFVEGCKTTSDMPESQASELWDKIEKFAGYGFNRSHAVEYSVISCIAMWLKVYYAPEFYAAALTILKEEKLEGLIKDAKARGIEVVPPDINISTGQFEILTDTKLCIPFNRIKGVSDNTTNAILKARETGPFTSISDLQERVERRKCNKSHVEKLDKVGAFVRIEGGLSASHPDRLRDQKELMPGLMIETVRVDRDMVADDAAKKAIMAVVREARALPGVHATPAMGKAPRFMVVSDGPTWAEEAAQKMTAAETFGATSEALHLAGLNKNDAYWTALVKRPKPEGEKFFDAEMIGQYAPFLRKEIEILKPPIIVCLGSATARFFIKDMKGGILDNCGKVVFDPTLDASIVVGINPGMVSFEAGRQKNLNEVFQQVAEMLR